MGGVCGDGGDAVSFGGDARLLEVAVIDGRDTRARDGM